MVQTQQIESAREIVPQQYAGDATYETQIDTEKDRYVVSTLANQIELPSSHLSAHTAMHAP